MCTLCDSTNINTIIAIETITADMLQTVWNEFDYRVDVCRITNVAHIEHHIRYVTKTWSVVLLNKKKYIYSYLKCIVYDKLLKPPQSFRITLYYWHPILVAALSKAWSLPSLTCWDCGFEFRPEHRCFSFVIVVCFHVEVSVSG